MVKILLISPRAKGIGGVAQHVSGLANKLIEKGYDVKIISCENTLYIPISRLKNLSFSIFSLFKTIGRKYDIIHAHNLPSIIPMKFAKGKKILTLHGIYSEQIKLLHGKFLGKISIWFEEKSLKWADKITVVSKKAREYYLGRGFEVEYIPNAIDLKIIPEKGIKEYDKQIVYVGRLSKEKGVDILIKAFEEIEDCHLLIIGDGPERNTLIKFAKGNPRIHFLGYKPREEAIKYIKGSDILVLPSRQEGLSTTILEAMACKTPVIATNVGGNPEIIEHMKTGILVKSENIQEIKEAIKLLLENKELAKKIKEEAYNLIIKEYEWNRVIEKYLKLYNIIL
ncbi:MAG: glycosyltransferase family 4 protein [Candidatus Methanomethylicaceae archaeon]